MRDILIDGEILSFSNGCLHAFTISFSSPIRKQTLFVACCASSSLLFFRDVYIVVELVPND
jgi:hypothetical protein